MITHSVFFRLHHAPDSEAEAGFFKKAAVLETIPGINGFKVLQEVSPKNPFRFGFSMEFTDQSAYDSYNNHPEHLRFVQEVWLEEVAEFQEIDYIDRNS